MADDPLPARANAESRLDATHDPGRRSWVESANSGSSEFPIQNLPYCVFRQPGTDRPGRLGVGIGDALFDLGGAHHDGLLTATGAAAGAACAEPNLNPLLGLGRTAWRSLRSAISTLLSAGVDAEVRRRAMTHLLPISAVELLLPARIGDYTDFYASIHHATNVGRMFRPDDPLLPNYKWLPIGYHGRASSIRIDGGCRRPWGQSRPGDADKPRFAPSSQLDYEAELGFLVGPGNALGEPIPVGQAGDHAFGVCLLNDWSARDIQPWEYRPLGPFLAKSFATTLSPWIITMEALAPFRIPAARRPPEDPEPLPYLRDDADQSGGGIDIDIEILIETEAMRRAGLAPERLARVRFADMYWTVAQLLAHHASNGCNLQPGDLLGSGTVSNDSDRAVGSLLELSRQGRDPVRLANAETRGFLEDGDEVILRASCESQGRAGIGFGECRGRIQPAQPSPDGRDAGY